MSHTAAPATQTSYCEISGIPAHQFAEPSVTRARASTAGRRGAEVSYQPVDEAADLPVKALVVPKEDAKDLGDGEGELPVRQPQQQPLVHVLAQKQGPHRRCR
jgi:hypothetical protein